MNLELSPQDRAFRDEVRAFFAEAVPPATRAKVRREERTTKAELVEWQRILHAKGWAVPHWPVEWGGTGWNAVQRYIFREELFAAGAPEPQIFNVNMLGPVLLRYGTEAQKQRFLPRAARLDDWWCQGFSEPGAGSDLAALRTTARRDGDHYVVNGQKVWTSTARHADWIFLLVRTGQFERKQQGISFLLADMKTPGITVRPIETMDGANEVNEVFFDDVRVPAELLVGEEHKGWSCAKYLLGHERVGIANIGLTRNRIRRIRDLASRIRVGTATLLQDRGFAEKLALLEMELLALEVTQLRTVFGQAGHDALPNATVLKITGSALQQRAAELLLEVGGPHAIARQDAEPEDDAVTPGWARMITPTYCYARAATIYGGTNEVLRNVMAKAELGF